MSGDIGALLTPAEERVPLGGDDTTRVIVRCLWTPTAPGADLGAD